MMKLLVLSILLVQQLYCSKNEQCVICWDNFEDEYSVETPCNHLYHNGCLNKWLENSQNSNCPICRKPLPSNNELLLIAAADGNLNEVRRLITNGADINWTDQHGRNAILYSVAADIPNEYNVNCLLQLGANPNAVSPWPHRFFPPLHLAVEKGLKSIVESLLKWRAHVNSYDENRETPLILATKSGRLDIVNILLEAGANSMMRDSNGKTAFDFAEDLKMKCVLFPSTKDELDMALLEAVREKKFRNVKYLLENNADANAQNYEGVSLLHVALLSKSYLPELCIIQILLAYGAHVNAKHPITGETPLIIAASRGWTDAVKLILYAGGDVHAVSTFGFNALHIAVELRSGLSVIEALLEENANVDALSVLSRETPLIIATRNRKVGQYEYVKFLLDAGADKMLNVDGRIPFELFSSHNFDVYHALKPSPEEFLLLAARRGQSELVKKMIDNGVDVNSTDKNDTTPLYHAVCIQDKSAVDFLLKQGADINAKNKHGVTILHMATLKGDENIVRALLERKPDVNAKDEDYGTPLMQGARLGRFKIVQMLIEAGADLNLKNLNGRTAFDLTKDQKCLDLLLPSTKQQLNIALMRAVEDRRYRTVKILILAGADANWSEQDYRGDVRTVLHEAVRRRDEPMVTVLLQNDADANAQTRYMQDTPIMMAAENEHEAVAKLLLDAGANLHLKNKQGKYAADQCSMFLLCFKLSQGELNKNLILAAQDGRENAVNNLIAIGANVKATDRAGRTALHFAALYQNKNIVYILLGKGADVRALTHDRVSALHMGAGGGNESIVHALLQRNPNIDARTLHNQETPLMFAARKQHVSVLQILLKAGANPKIKNFNGQTAIHLCKNQQCCEVFKKYEN